MDFNVLANEYGEKRYGMIKWLMVALLLTAFAGEAMAADLTKIQWEQGISSTLYRDQVITYNGYTAKVVMFPPPVESDRYKAVPDEPVEPYVGLNISKDGVFINTTVLGLADSYVSPDGNVKITVKKLPSKYGTEWLFESYNPWVVLEMDPRGEPVLGITADTEQDEYTSSPSTEIVAVVTLENSGTADAINVDANLETELQVKRGSLNYHFDKIGIGETVTKTVTFFSPAVTEQRTVSILANISGYDVMDNFYNSEFERTVTISGESPVSLSIRKSANDKAYLKDNIMVSLSLTNGGKYDLKNVSITDSVPPEFKLLNNNSLHWVIDIPAGGYWDFHYLLKPLTPNKDGIVMTSAMAEFRQQNEYYSIQSNHPVVIIYGPMIAVTKKTDVSEISPGDTVTVTVEVENTGSTPTKVTINDTLPESTTLVNGSTEFDAYLQAGEQAAFTYAIKINSNGPVRLPGAVAEYYELGTKGGKVRSVSPEQEIGIRAPEVQATPQKTEPPEIIVTPPPEVTTPTPPPSTPAPKKPEIGPPKKPVVIQLPNVSSPEIEELLNFMLGCQSGNNGSTIINNACTFYNSKNDSSNQ
ncbi:MAG: hypothetical protein O8C66_08765 [Candidatus Methanoperedens sp.]|nr:hypothetical protein [Candidatus Methanoperedens sp.]